MITTIVDETYLYREARYLLASIYKNIPNEKIYLFLVNCNEEVKADVLKWNPNTTIDFRTFDVPKEQYKSYMYVMMTFVFDWLLNDIKTKEDIIYLDADIVLKGNLDNLYKDLDKYDLMFRYHPFNRIKGPTTDEFGGIMNNGCVVVKNNTIMAEYSKKLRKNIQNYLDTKKDPVIFLEEAKVITCIDQEMEFTTYLDMKDKIKFFPIDNIYNDTQYTDIGIVWHAKGVHRTYPEYLIECHKYGREDINILKEYCRLYYRKFKKFIKSFLIEPKESFHIKELEDILKSIEVKSIVIVNSDFYLDNEDILEDTDIECIKCYDTDPLIYHKNKKILEERNITHKYIVYDASFLTLYNTELLISEEKNLKNLKITENFAKIIKTKRNISDNIYRLSDNYILETSKLQSTVNNLQEKSYKYSKFLHPKWNNFIVKNEVYMFLDYLKNIDKDVKILEIGAGDGYCAYKLKEFGFSNIIATDIEPRYPAFFNVDKVGAAELPFDNNEFDIIISMSVLEHIPNINIAMNELSRVLKNDGFMLHTMPTPYLNLLTIILLPLAYIRGIFYLCNGYWLDKFKPLEKKNVLRFIKFIFLSLNPIKIFYYPGHGVYGMFSSFYYWSIFSWKKSFTKSNLVIEEVKGLNFLLSLLKLFPFKFIFLRKKIGEILPPVNLYIIKKENDDTKRT